MIMTSDQFDILIILLALGVIALWGVNRYLDRISRTIASILDKQSERRAPVEGLGDKPELLVHIRNVLKGIVRHVSGHKNFPWPSVEWLEEYINKPNNRKGDEPSGKHKE